MIYARNRFANLKFGSFGGNRLDDEIGTLAKSRHISDDEVEDWPGHIERRRVRVGVSKLVRAYIGSSPPSKDVALTDGAINAPRVDSLEISLCNLALRLISPPAPSLY